MSTSISSNALVNQLTASYQKLAQAQSRVQESKAQVAQDQAQLARSQDRHEKDRKDYSVALHKNQSLQQSDTQYAVQTGTGTQQVASVNSSAISLGTPTVNSSGQTVGTTISVTA